ncbi:MAG TPA: NAD(P)-dependent alcohol dehydrogenase [Spongiibacteraceae bacterium]|nr:NAD(P)-dependent alcohol dehydrogenase [Spongiibacteraceae bacterium]
MKAFVTRTMSGIDSLEMTDIPAPGGLASGQIRIKVRAVSLNYRDLLAVSGTIGKANSNGFIPCSDCAGEVVEVGVDTPPRIKLGDRVSLIFNPDWIGGPWRSTTGVLCRGSGLPGVMCEEIVVHHSEAVVLPEHLSYEEGATLACAGITAWHALCGEAPLIPGMSVLLQGAGGVSVFALQFAKLFGARVIMTSSSPERCARLKALGADETIDYNAYPEWNKVVRELTKGQGVDLTVEVGGAGTVDRSVASTSRGGRIALVGLLTGWPNTVSSMFSAGVHISPIAVGSRDDFDLMNRAIAFHKLKPVIDSRFAFEQLPEALRYLQSGRHFGKIVINA